LFPFFYLKMISSLVYFGFSYFPTDFPAIFPMETFVDLLPSSLFQLILFNPPGRINGMEVPSVGRENPQWVPWGRRLRQSLFPLCQQYPKQTWEFSFILLISYHGRAQGKRNNEPIQPGGGGEDPKKGKNRVSLAHKGSQGGNGLLHLIHTAGREFEHRGD